MSEVKEFDRENFTESMIAGEKGEIEIYRFLKRGGYEFIHKLPGKNSDYDYKCRMIREKSTFYIATSNVNLAFSAISFASSSAASREVKVLEHLKIL